MAKVEQFIEKLSRYKKLTLDTNTIIYFLGGVPEFIDLLTPVFEMIELGRLKAVISVISEAELLLKPHREANDAAIEAVMFFLDEFPNLDIVPVSREISRQAAKICADLSIRLPDAIILATALNTESDLLLGNDLKLMHRAASCLPAVSLKDYI